MLPEQRHICSVDLVQRRDLFDVAFKLVNPDVWISFYFIFAPLHINRACVGV